MGKPTGGAAFPHSVLTLRDYFAAQALAALVTDGWTPGRLIHEDALAEDAYAIADAMLKARRDAD